MTANNARRNRTMRALVVILLSASDAAALDQLRERRY
jgi:hypothetical protein